MSTFFTQNWKYLNDDDDDDDDDDAIVGLGGGDWDDDDSDHHFRQYRLVDPQEHIQPRPCFLRYKWFMFTKGPC